MDKKLSGEALEGCILGCMKVAWAMVLAVPSAVISGWCLSLIWLWFLVPLGVSPISIAHAIGIAVILGWSLVSLRGPMSESEGYKAYTKKYGITTRFLIIPLTKVTVLGQCWIIHHFFM